MDTAQAGDLGRVTGLRVKAGTPVEASAVALAMGAAFLDPARKDLAQVGQLFQGQQTLSRRSAAALLGMAPNHAGIQLLQVIRDRGALYCLGRKIWHGEAVELSARTIVNPVF